MSQKGTAAPEQSAFGPWLESQLHTRRMSVQEFAERAKVSRGGVYLYIKGQRLPDQAALTKIADALSIGIEDMPRISPKRVGRPPKL